MGKYPRFSLMNSRILGVVTFLMLLPLASPAQVQRLYQRVPDLNFYTPVRTIFDFSQSPPLVQFGPLATNDRLLEQRLTLASISDACGQLRYYSDGRRLLDARGVLVPGGGRLVSRRLPHRETTFSSAPNALLFVPRPLSRDRYFLFTSEQGICGFSTQPCPQGIRRALSYAEIGPGAPDGTGQVERADVMLHPQGVTALTATHHTNRKDYWVVTRPLLSTRFFSYHVTERGVEAQPVVSQVRSFADSVRSPRLSPNGQYIYYTGFVDSIASQSGYFYRGFARSYLARFDATTGRISQEVQVYYTVTCGDFSPDSRSLYLGPSDVPRGMRQMTINLADSLAMQTTMKWFASDPTPTYDEYYWPSGRIVLTPDLRISYLDGALKNRPCPPGSIPNSICPEAPRWIGQIRYPDRTDTTRQLRHHSFPAPMYAFPYNNYIESLLVDTLTEVRHLGGCGTDTVQFWLANPGCATTLRWQFDDPASGAANETTNWAPRHVFSQAGVYQVTVTTDDGRTYPRRVAVDASGVGGTPPNIFTPNDDGLNDIFLPLAAADGPAYRFQVFNRWGAAVFTSTTPGEAWRGEGLAGGVYFYRLSALDCAGQVRERHGTVTLMR